MTTTCPSDLRTIARALGGDVIGRQVVAPGPGHSARDRSLSIRLSATAPDGFLAFSHSGDDFAACRDHVKRALGISTDRPAPPKPRPAHGPAEPTDERVKAYIADLVAKLQPVRGTPGEAYLRDVRRIDAKAIADVLERVGAIGWHPHVKFNEPGHELHGQHLGCIVARMTDATTTNPTGAITRTYLREGRKIGKAKALGLGGGVVRLSLDEDVEGGLFLGEGLETCLAAMSIGLRPMWSAGSTAIMAKIPVLGGVECLTVLADHDLNGAGERAARELAARWTEAGKSVRLWIPTSPGDLNDALRWLL